MAADPYVIAGTDLRTLVVDWVTVLEAGGGQSRGLLELVDADPAAHRYFFGGYYLMANIGARASKETATSEELLLYGVLSVFQMADWPGSDRWEGEEAHVSRAFAYFHEIGEREAARRLREDVIARSLQKPAPASEALLNTSLKNDPARRAAHEQKMASIDSRNSRAAELLDPDGNFDAELMALQKPDA